MRHRDAAQTLVFAAHCAMGTGHGVVRRSIFTFTARKIEQAGSRGCHSRWRHTERVSREKTGQRRLRALPLSYLPINGGEGRIRTDNHALRRRSNSNLTTRKENHRENGRPGWSWIFSVEVTLISLPRESGASTESCTPLSAVPGRCIADYALPAWSRRKDLHLRSPSGCAFTARCNCFSATPRL